MNKVLKSHEKIFESPRWDPPPKKSAKLFSTLKFDFFKILINLYYVKSNLETALFVFFFDIDLENTIKKETKPYYKIKIETKPN